MKFALLLLLAPPQKSTLHTFKISAGEIHCTFSNYQPAALTGLHIECVSPAANFKGDDVVSGAGKSGALFVGRDTIKWTFQNQSDGSLLYRIEANGKPEIGSL